MPGVKCERMSIESDTDRLESVQPLSVVGKGMLLQTNDRAEMSPQELADYESGVRELFEKVPELFVNFKSEDLEPQEFPTDRVLEEIIQERHETTSRRITPPIDQRTAPQVIPPPSARQ